MQIEKNDDTHDHRRNKRIRGASRAYLRFFGVAFLLADCVSVIMYC